MLFPFLEKILKPTKRSWLRQMMRGYRKLKKSGKLSQIELLKEELTKTQLTLKPTDFSSQIMGYGASCGENIVRQYLLVRIGGHSFNKALLRSLGKNNGKVIYPLPHEWQKVIQKHGFEVDYLKSNILWQLYILGCFLYGSLKALGILFIGLTSISLKRSKQHSYVYFFMLTQENLPQKQSQSKSYDVISWYLQWEKKAKKLNFIFHGVPEIQSQVIDGVEIQSRSNSLPSLNSLQSCLKYSIWCVSAILHVVIDCIRGRWWHALLLNQAAISAQIRCVDKKLLALDYLFHNSGPTYRPLWTYDAEKFGSRILFYFYSTNSENFKISESEASIPPNWRMMSWPHYLVWDRWQEEFIKKSLGSNVLVDIVGPIWFNSNSLFNLPNIENMIAVFDVQPQRDTSYRILGIPFEYYIPSVANNFLIDIHTAAFKKNINIFLKRKRDIGSLTHPSYRKVLKKLICQSNFYEVDASLSPWTLIEKTLGVISMPFTSTALIARHLGKPSIYYDPTGQLRNDDPAAHGIPVLSSLTDLKNWINKIHV